MAVQKTCPLDGSPLTPMGHGDMQVDACHHCGGIWFEVGEFAKLVRQPQELDAIEAEAAPDGAAQPASGLDRCPAGHGLMERYEYAMTSNVTLDRCATCGGIWLDDRECARVANRARSGGTTGLTPDQAAVVAEVTSQHVATMARLQAEEDFINFIGRRRYWLLPNG